MATKSKVTPSAVAELETARDKAATMEKELVTALSELEQAVEKWSKEVEGGRTMVPDPRVTPSAQARLEIAKEKARIMGKKPGAAISELEQAAQRLKDEKELGQAQPAYRGQDDSPISITSVPLLTVMDKGRRDEEIVWRQHRLHPEERPRQIKMNAAMINSIAQHLKAREWARAMGTTRRQANNGHDLGKEAEQWLRRRDLERRGFPETNERSASR